MKKSILGSTLCITFLCLLIIGYYIYDILYGTKYYNENFGIPSYVSEVDFDKDGIDDQTDILNSAKSYVETKPLYKSVYYETGYSNDEYGVCTDVVANALKGAGYDLMLLVNADILANRVMYNIDEVDINIDFRRVENLFVYFTNTAESLTTDPNDIDQWQGGDIVVFEGHIGIVSDRRNEDGITYVIHHSDVYQIFYEEEILSTSTEIIGHFRVS